MAGRDIVVTDQGSIIFKEEEGGGVHGVSLKGPNAADADYNIKLPAAVPGASGQIINADVSGDVVTLSFAALGNVGMAGVNVLSYASGDGVTDDSGGITDAINAAEDNGAADNADRVIFPAGVYRTLGTSTAFQSSDADEHNYWLEGAGMGATTIKHLNTSDSVMFDGEAVRTFVIRNMTINGNGQTDNPVLLVNTAPYILIENVEFVNTAKAIKIQGDPKVIIIRNCRFTELTKNGTGPAIDITGITSDCDLIFSNNYVEGIVPAGEGLGTQGLSVSSSGVAKNVRCFIRDNHFVELGSGSIGSVKILHGDDSIVDSNIFTNFIATPIQIGSSSRVRIVGNKIHGESTLMKDADEVYGISVDADVENVTDVEVSGNTIIGDDETDIGIRFEGDTSADDTKIENIILSGNMIEGCQDTSIYMDNVLGNINIIDNTIHHPLSGNEATYKYSSVYIDNIGGDAHLKISGNVFDGGTTSGRALYFDRSAGTQTAGNVHVVLENNFINSMGQHATFSNPDNSLDLALIYIAGASGSDLISTFHASGNRYDLATTDDYVYGMMVKDIAKSCTFESILDFGAIGDGLEDCTMAINRAAEATGADGPVNIPKGTFAVSDHGTALDNSTSASVSASEYCVIVPATGQLWSGPGVISQIAASSTKSTVYIAQGDTTLDNLTLKCGATNAGVAILTAGGVPAANVSIKDCRIEAYKYGIRSDVPSTKIVGCHIKDTIADGRAIEINSTGYNSTINGNTISSDTDVVNDNGIVINAKSVSVANNSIVNVAASAIKVTSAANNATINGNNIDAGTGWETGFPVIWVDTVTGVNISNNTIVGTGTFYSDQQDIRLNNVISGSISGNTLTSKQIKIEIAETSNNISIVSNALRNSDDVPKIAADGIKLSANTSAVTITGNTLTKVKGDGSSGAAGSDVAIDLGTADDNIVNGNVLNNHNTGMVILDGGNNNTLSGNRCMSGITLCVSDAGDNTVIMNNDIDQRLTFPVLHSPCLAFGSGTPDVVVTTDSDAGDLTTGTLNVDPSAAGGFIRIRNSGSGTDNITRITIAGKNTVKVGTRTAGATLGAAWADSEAAESEVYDGMILLIQYWGPVDAGVLSAEDDYVQIVSLDPVFFSGSDPQLLAGHASATARCGSNIVSAGGGTHMGLKGYRNQMHDNGGTCLLRFQFDSARAEGWWQILTPAGVYLAT